MRVLVPLLSIVCLFGCQLLGIGEKSAKHAALPTPEKHLKKDAIVVEITTVRVPYERREHLAYLWKQVDEQALNPELRRQMQKNGLRAGVLNAESYAILAQFAPESGPQDESLISDSPFEVRYRLGDSEKSPIAYSTDVTLVPGKRSKLCPRPEPIPELNLFWEDENNNYSGKTYRNAACAFLLSAATLAEQYVLVDLTPEMEYGEEKMGFVVVNNEFEQKLLRQRKNFENLRVNHSLKQGQMLILGASSENAAGLGRSIFITDTEPLEQKFLVIRIKSAP